MDSDIRGVLIALIIVIVIFAIGMGGHFFAVSARLREAAEALERARRIYPLAVPGSDTGDAG
jgi:flagellar basal body-associated protein FliL